MGTVNVHPDYFGVETTWRIINSSQAVVEEGGSFAESKLYSESLCLDAGAYTFAIYDVYGDGMCCLYGNGYFNVTLGENVLMSVSDDSSWQELVIDFTVAETRIPSISSSPSIVS